ncbi:MAG: TIGR00725 family protein [Nitrospinota bacterium]|nr:TIGR00725 family protein [Nitrospinota bacterium]
MSAIIGVIGDSNPSKEVYELAVETGREIARRKAILVCGGLGGIMEAVSMGAKELGGMTIGILPDYDISKSNEYVDIPIATGMGHARNVIIAATAHALIALPGSYGTLSEISHGLKLGKKVVALGREESPPDVVLAKNPQHAVELALDV